MDMPSIHLQFTFIPSFHFHTFTALILIVSFPIASVSDCEYGEWGDWSECKNCQQSRHLIPTSSFPSSSSSFADQCQPLTDSQLCEECRCDRGEWAEWGECDCVTNVRNRKRGGDFPLCHEMVAAEHCLCDEINRRETIRSSGEDWDPSDLVINEFHGSSSYRNVCEPSPWSEWGECAGRCDREGFASRRRTLETCVEEVDEMICTKMCDPLKTFMELEELEEGDQDGMFLGVTESVKNEVTEGVTEEDIHYEIPALAAADFEDPDWSEVVPTSASSEEFSPEVIAPTVSPTGHINNDPDEGSYLKRLLEDDGTEEIDDAEKVVMEEEPYLHSNEGLEMMRSEYIQDDVTEESNLQSDDQYYTTLPAEESTSYHNYVKDESNDKYTSEDNYEGKELGGDEEREREHEWDYANEKLGSRNDEIIFDNTIYIGDKPRKKEREERPWWLFKDNEKESEKGRKYDRDRGKDRKRNRGRNNERRKNRECECSRNRERGKDRGWDRDKKREKGIDRDKGSDRERKNNKDRERKRERDMEREEGREWKEDRGREGKRNRDMDRQRDRDEETGREKDRKKERDRDIDRDKNREREKERDNDRKKDRNGKGDDKHDKGKQERDRDREIDWKPKHWNKERDSEWDKERNKERNQKDRRKFQKDDKCNGMNIKNVQNITKWSPCCNGRTHRYKIVQMDKENCPPEMLKRVCYDSSRECSKSPETRILGNRVEEQKHDDNICDYNDSTNVKDITDWTRCCNGKNYQYKIIQIIGKYFCHPKALKRKCDDSSNDCGTCFYGKWGNWSDCSKSCGNGVQTRTRLLEKGPPRHCNDIFKAKVCKERPCIGCEVTDWSEWSECPTTCLTTNSRRSRTRHIIGTPDDATGCNLTFIEHKDCISECSDEDDNIDNEEEDDDIDNKEEDEDDKKDEKRKCQFTEWSGFEKCEDLCGAKKEMVPTVRYRKLVQGSRERCARKLKEFDMRGNEMPNCPFLCEPEPDKAVTSEWSKWNACFPGCLKNRTLPYSTSRRRKVIMITSLDPNPVLEETKRCDIAPPLCKDFTCQVSDWSEWAACSVKCGSGTTYRSRVITGSVTRQQLERCPRLREEVSCDSGVECELVDCKVGMWAEWRITGKTRFRTRPVLQQPNEHGQLCPNLMEKEACTPDTCSGDCEVSQWQEWSPCPDTCISEEEDQGKNEATRQRRRQIIRLPRNGGEECPSLVETDTCNLQVCRDECQMSEWGEWVSLNSQIYIMMKRERIVEVVSQHGIDKCPDLVEFRDCSVEDCQLECQFSDWSEFGECSAQCVGPDSEKPARTRTRTIRKGYEATCQSPVLEQSAYCNDLPMCPKCQDTDWSAWSECDKVCGYGEETRFRTKPIKRGKCKKLVNKRPCIHKQCDEVSEPCEVGQWADWSPCTPKCGDKRQKTRLRTVIINVENAVCPPATQSRRCDARECKCDETSWSRWSESSCDCKRRRRTIYRVIRKKNGECRKEKRSKRCRPTKKDCT